MSPGNILGQNYIYLDFQNNYLSFDKRYNINCTLKSSGNQDFYTGVVPHILINSIKLNTVPLNVNFDVGTDKIRLPKHLYEDVIAELINYSNIPLDNSFWIHNSIFLCNLSILNLPPIEFIFGTDKGLYKWIIKKEDYVGKIGENKYVLLIEEGQKDIIFGHTTMKTRKIGFEHNIGNRVYLY